jgi:hypothetical protein
MESRVRGKAMNLVKTASKWSLSWGNEPYVSTMEDFDYSRLAEKYETVTGQKVPASVVPPESEWVIYPPRIEARNKRDGAADMLRKEKAAHRTHKKFLEYHASNPHVYAKMLFQARDAGYKTYGFPLIFNICRWELGVKTKNTEFELNNDIAPYYSRLIQQEYPELLGFFETRTSVADEVMGFESGNQQAKLKAAKPKAVPAPVPEVPKKPVKGVYYIEEGDNDCLVGE